MDINSSMPSGLSKTQLEENIKKFGLNVLPKKKSKTLFQIYLEQHKNPIIYILIFAAFAAFSIKEFSDGFFILGVLVINAIIGTYQEYKAEIKAKSLEESFKTETTVIRDGQTQIIESNNLTIDDIVLLESGSKVPADIHLKHSQDLLVDESLLTGESIEVKKDAKSTKTHTAYAGTIVSKGRAYGKVQAIGLNSQIGKIATLLAEASKGKAPLEIRIKKLSTTIVKSMSFLIGILIIIGFFKGMPFYTLLLFCVALMVSAIPEGLPIAITIALSSASYAMSKKGVIIRKLSAIEALGSCTLIASDKTGTLTKNELSVDRFVYHDKALKTIDNSEHIVKVGSILCNEMKYEQNENGLKFIGDQVDIALAKHAISPDEEYLLAPKKYKKVDDIPYESQNRYSAIMVHKDDIQYEFIKGSPETILEFCDVSSKEKQKIMSEVNEYASDGFRNIAIAYKEDKISHKSNKTITLENFQYLGFMAIIDPIREESFGAVKTAQEAGIDVIMITGDHPNTAFYISKQLGICNSEYQVMDDNDLLRWKETGSNPKDLENIKVFARVNPEQKKDIVCALQDLGHFVAVTGDGVNDAPALKHSNIGIAMGKGGTDIAKSVGDIILTDDNFNSIINGIKEGRRAYDNIRKVVYLLISTGFAELILISFVFLFGLPLPLLPVQLLWINLVTNGFQDVLLAIEGSEKGILKRKPRKPHEKIFNSTMIKRVLVGGLYMAITAFIVFYLLLENGFDEYSARNITVLLMVLFENVHVFNSRTEVNFLHQISYKNSTYLIVWVIFTQLLHVSCMHIDFMQNLLSLEPVSFSIWLYLFIVASGLVVVMEIEKFIRKRFPSGERPCHIIP